MRYRYLLFDADDTLFDFPKASSQAFSALCQAHSLPDTPETRARYHAINLELWAAFDRWEISKEVLLHERFVRFLKELRLSRDPDACNATYLSALGQVVFPLPHAEEVCRELSRRGHLLYIVTNAVASVQRSRLKACPFGDVFQAAFISEEAGAAKPDLAYYQYVQKQLPELTPSNSLVIGDSLTSDIQGANAAGLPCCWYNPHETPRPPHLRIDYEIKDLRELLTFV